MRDQRISMSNTTVNNGDWKNRTQGKRSEQWETGHTFWKKRPTDEGSTIISQASNNAHTHPYTKRFRIQQQMIKEVMNNQ